MTAQIIYPPQWRSVITGPTPATITTSGRAAALVNRVKNHSAPFEQNGPEGLRVDDVVEHKTYQWQGIIESFAWGSHAMVRAAFNGGPAKLIAVPLGELTRIDGDRACQE